MNIRFINVISRLSPGYVFKGANDGGAFRIQRIPSPRHILKADSFTHGQLDILRGNITSDGIKDPGRHSVHIPEINGGNGIEGSIILGGSPCRLPWCGDVKHCVAT